MRASTEQGVDVSATFPEHARGTAIDATEMVRVDLHVCVVFADIYIYVYVYIYVYLYTPRR
jgi:hypothetical protein